MGCCCPSMKRAKVTRRAGGTSPSMTAAISGALGPETRTMPIPPRPGGVAAATMVSARVIVQRLSAFPAGLNPPIDIPLLRDGQHGIGDPIKHQPRRKERKHRGHYERHEHEDFG